MRIRSKNLVLLGIVGLLTVSGIRIEAKEIEKIDTMKAPNLTITEILPDSSNVGGADAYEFVEIFNNADKSINLKDYRLYYTYPDTGVQNVWWETREDKILESGQSIVFWIKNGKNDNLTRTDFNSKFGVNLSEDQLIEISCGGMANSGKRGLCLKTNVGDVVDEVIYNDNNADNTTADKSITFQNQYKDDLFITVMTSDKEVPIPGKIGKKEKPMHQSSVQVPEKKPKVVDCTKTEFNNETDSLAFSIEAVSEDSTIKTVVLHMKDSNQTDYASYNLLRSNEDKERFERVLKNVDILNKKSFSYYFEVSDGFSTIMTEEKTIFNTDSEMFYELNLKDGDVITDHQQIIASGSQLFIDDQEYSQKAEKSINGSGKIVFEATDTDVFFKNAVAVDGDVVGVFNEGTYENVVTYVYDINANKFDSDKKTITVEFHAGNKANVLEHNIENNDDFILRNIRMILPNGKTLTPVSYEAKKGLGAVEHDNLDQVKKTNINVPSQESNISMGDGTSKYEILYANFQLEDSDFEAIRYLWDTTQVQDGIHSVSNGKEKVSVIVDNTAPEITSNIEEGKQYHNGTIEVISKDAISQEVNMAVMLDGKTIDVPYDFRALEMLAGEHIIHITARDQVGNIAEKEIHFTTPEESASVDENVYPENGSIVNKAPILMVTPTDATNDKMTVTFKKGEKYQLGDPNIVQDRGVSAQNGTIEKIFEEKTGNGFPYDSFSIKLDSEVNENTIINVEWSGKSNNTKTFMYVYNTVSKEWEKVETENAVNGEEMVLTGKVKLKNHILNEEVKLIVQNGEGYTPLQSEKSSSVKTYAMNETPDNVETYNENDTPREEYDFTFAIESDTQYYNEDYDGNGDQSNDGKYQHQMNIHNWILGNRNRMNIQYLFHDGDIIDDEPNIKEWIQADAAYKKLDNAKLPYGILAGNHDVGHLTGDYSNFGKYFGENRYLSNPWYGGSYKNNRGHYDLITIDGIDFIMIYMGWGIGDEEIQWMNDVLAQYPERKAILNFHEYLLASGGFGEEPQRIHDEVVAENENVCMVLSGHYHNAKTRIDTFTNEDGSTRNVYNMLFDYQGLMEGGAGYMRLLHFDVEGQRMIVRTFTPSYGGSDFSNYGDYDAKQSETPNAGNEFFIENANLNDAESFEIPFSELGIVPKVKILETDNLKVNVYKEDVIGSVTNVKSGTTASYEWKDAQEGINGWYAEITDENGGLSRTNVYYVNVQLDTEKPVLTVPQNTVLEEGNTFDALEGVTASDNVDGDITDRIIIKGKVNLSISGQYELTYEVTDTAGNSTRVNRTVIVKPKGNISIDSQNTGKPIDNLQKPEISSEKQMSVKTGDVSAIKLFAVLSALALFVGGSEFIEQRKNRREKK